MLEGPRNHEREGRHGPTFGTVVHRALELCLRSPGLTAAAAVDRALREASSIEHRAEAVADVERGLATLAGQGLGVAGGPELRLEYPVAGPAADGQMLQGYIDLVCLEDGQITLIDFKTDQPPTGPVAAALPAYAAQVLTYARLLTQAGLAAHRTRCGLLFTADGGLRWVE